MYFQITFYFTDSLNLLIFKSRDRYKPFQYTAFFASTIKWPETSINTFQPGSTFVQVTTISIFKIWKLLRKFHLLSNYLTQPFLFIKIVLSKWKLLISHMGFSSCLIFQNKKISNVIKENYIYIIVK